MDDMSVVSLPLWWLRKEGQTLLWTNRDTEGQNGQNEAEFYTLKKELGKKKYLLQDLPNFLVEADWDSVEGSIQTPPAEPLAVSSIPDAGKVLRNIQGLDGWQPVPLNNSRGERNEHLRLCYGSRMEEL